MPTEERKLQDLVSIGPAMLRDFELLGIASVSQLSRQNPEKLYEHLCRITGQPVDMVFSKSSRTPRRSGRDLRRRPTHSSQQPQQMTLVVRLC